ncbi:hypothetical protein JZ751_024043 [Albula glossodonta]|uniref:RRM domain-containing protein n=1 Tax=Albula glossodonta TaxID=121402 RepID=A0A8T2NFP7_9TELE|nr:hypothetical protein JZ751_024043 [Albula glossodonta]
MKPVSLYHHHMTRRILPSSTMKAGEVTYADTNKGQKNNGVIEFRLYSDMKRALKNLNGNEVNGRKIRLIEDRPGSRRRRSYSCSRSRSRLSYRAREKDVEKFFKGYGKILEVDLKNG